MRILKWFGGVLLTLIIVLLIAPFIALAVIDQQEIKNLAQDAVRDATDRELTLAGDISANLSLQPSFSISDVTLSNANWGEEPHFAKIKRLSVGLSIPALLSGNIAIAHIELENGHIAIEKSKDGALNLPEPKQSETSEGGSHTETNNTKSVAAETHASNPTESSSLSIAKLSIKNMQLLYNDHTAGKAQRISINNIQATHLTPKSAKVNTIDMLWQKQVGVSGTADLGEDLLTLALAIKSLNADNSITLEGYVKEPLTSPELSFALDAQIPTPSALPVEGLSAIPAISLQANVSGTQQFIQLSDLVARIAEQELRGNASVRLGDTKPSLQADLSADKLDVAAFSHKASASASGDIDSARKASAQKPNGGRAIPDTPFPTDGMDAANASIAFKAKSVMLKPDLALQNLSAQLKLENGVLALKPVSFGISGGQVDASLNYNAQTATPTLGMMVTGTNIALGDLLASQGMNDLSDGKTNLILEMNGTGTSLHSWLGTAKGKLYTHVDTARYKAPESLVEGYDLLSILSGEGTPKDQVDIACFVTSAEIASGTANIRNITLKTPVAYVIGKGDASLVKEDVSLSFKAKSNLVGFADVIPAIKVSGPWSSISATADASSTLFTVGKWALGSATGVGLAALVGEQVTDKMGITEDANPCLDDSDIKALQEAEQQNKDNPIKSAEKAVKNIGKNAEDTVRAIRDGKLDQIKEVEDTVRGLRDGLKGLLGN